MQLLRNKEVRTTFLIQFAFVLIAGVVAAIYDMRLGAMVFAFGMALVVFNFYVTMHRYKRLSQMAAQIDQILHGQANIPFHKHAEGELAILESEIHKMTTRLSEQRQQLQADKVFLADSIADISHQIRTPLTSINLLVNFLADPDTDEEEQMRLLREMRELHVQIEWLINSLLKMSKLDAGTIQFKKETVSLLSLIQLAVEPIQVAIDIRDQQLVVEAEGAFTGDTRWTAEAITNISKNCMEHMEAGGVLTIQGSSNEIFTEIVITDTGKGIDEEDLPNIFERFYKGKNSDPTSVGIGLALARTIIISQNGTLKAENVPNGGARFTMRFYKQIV